MRLNTPAMRISVALVLLILNLLLLANLIGFIPDKAEATLEMRKILSETPSIVAQETGIIPTEGAPDYQYMISVVRRVRAIFPADETREGAALLSKKPVRLFQDQVPAKDAEVPATPQ